MVAAVRQPLSSCPARLSGSLAQLALVAAVDGLVPRSFAQGRVPSRTTTAAAAAAAAAPAAAVPAPAAAAAAVLAN